MQLQRWLRAAWKSWSVKLMADKYGQMLQIDCDGLTGELRHDEPMSRHSSWRTGGSASWFYKPSDIDDLGRFLNRLPKETRIAWCGLGSNLLVRDGGFDGVVISTHKALKALWLTEKNGIYAEAGVPGAKLAKFAAKNSLCGAEFMIGIPGTVGGALFMNAGCFGVETWQIVRHADTINRKGETLRRAPNQVRWGYRSVEIDALEWFTGAEFELTPCKTEHGQGKIRNFLKKRAATQPVQTANAGSVFRNPNGDYAARLLDAAGLKGYAIGAARVSPVHANFIENTGHASACDIELLIDHMTERVDALHGIQLELEVKIIGEKAQQ